MAEEEKLLLGCAIGCLLCCCFPPTLVNGKTLACTCVGEPFFLFRVLQAFEKNPFYFTLAWNKKARENFPDLMQGYFFSSSPPFHFSLLAHFNFLPPLFPVWEKRGNKIRGPLRRDFGSGGQFAAFIL